MIKLSICIATHNRALFLDETLKSIVNQLTEECELVIYDSLSTDNTSDIVKKYMEIFSAINYVYSNEKLGIDIDYDKCISHATGQYCWLFSDDDTIEDGCINYLLSKISLDKYSLILVNSSIYDITLFNKVAEKYLKINSDLEFDSQNKSFNKFFETAAEYLSFIGCVVINRKEWVSRNRFNYYGTEFIHVGVIFQSYFLKNILVISEPFIRIRLGNSQWYGRAFKIWIHNWPNLIWSFPLISSKSKNTIIGKYPSDQIFKLIYFRALGAFSFSEFIKFDFPNRLFSILRYILVFFVSFFPKLIFRLPYILYAYIFDKEYMLRDLLKERK